MEPLITFFAGAATMGILFLVREKRIDRESRGSQDYDRGYTQALNDMHRKIARLHANRDTE